MEAAIRVRAIQYETVPGDLADGLGLSPVEVKKLFADLNDLAVLWCANQFGQRLTAVGDPNDLREMLSRDEPRRRDDRELARSRWPVLLRGWRQAS